jgi:uncharacterized protein YdeI (YjbR/CyaY-like superfamily)
LARNCKKKREIWLLYDKKESGKQAVSYNDSVEEALCFGWIDGVLKSISKRQYVRRFSPRREKSSNWSAPNKKRLKRMLESGKVSKHGMKFIPDDVR